MSERRSRVVAYVAITCLAAVAALVAMAQIGRPPLGANEWSFWVLGLLVVGSELVPLRVPLGEGEREAELTISSTFALAQLLVVGPLAAALWLGGAAVVADLSGRKPIWKLAFNAAQYVLPVAAAGLLIDVSGTWWDASQRIGAADVGTAVAAGGVFAIVNMLVMSGVVAMRRPPLQRPGARLAQTLRENAPFLSWSYAVLMSLGPVVAVVAEASLAAVLLFAVPMLAVYQATAIYLERQRTSLHDVLTGLPNRSLFEDRVVQAIAVGRRSGTRAAVLVLDLDGFKEVNATFGYAVGDRLLREVAVRLRRVVREVDTIARLGADEFGLVLVGVGSPEDVGVVVAELRTAVVRPFVVDGVSMAVEASVGGAISPDDGTDATAIITAADEAMDEAKAMRVGFRWYAPARRSQLAGRMQLLAELRVAIDEGQLELHYQPKAALPSGRISGLEALVRWRRPNGELVSPGSFLPVAEDTGLIRDMTRYVVAAAVAQLRTWQDAGTPTEVAVNISARDLQDASLPDFVVEQLELHDVPAHCLQLEITEASIMVDVDKAVEILDRLHKIGVGLAIDDFGTGNTSLSKLPLLPVDVLKIDRSFVERLEDAPDDLIVRTTIDLSRGFGFQVVAEGVSSAVIYDRVVVLGVDYAQGFHLWRPLPVAEVGILLSAGSAGGS